LQLSKFQISSRTNVACIVSNMPNSIMDTDWGGQALNSSHMENVVAGNHTNIVRHISSR
jgi:hypothetical protein